MRAHPSTPRRVKDGEPVEVPLPPAPPSSPVTATASTSTRKKRNKRKKALRLQSEENEKKRRKVFDDDDDDDYSDDEENQNRTDVEEESGVQARTLTMMVTTPVKKTPPSANDVAQKHGISPRKTPGRRKKNRKNSGTGGCNEMTAMIHSFKSVSLSWHDARSVDLRMWRMQR